MLIMPHQKEPLKCLWSLLLKVMPHKKLELMVLPQVQLKQKLTNWRGKNESALKKLHKLIPYKRIGIPEGIGAFTAWLASDESEYTWHNTIC